MDTEELFFKALNEDSTEPIIEYLVESEEEIEEIVYKSIKKPMIKDYKDKIYKKCNLCDFKGLVKEGDKKCPNKPCKGLVMSCWEIEYKKDTEQYKININKSKESLKLMQKREGE